MGATTAVARARLPYPSEYQFVALETLLEAYYSFNAADQGPDSRIWAIEAKHSPMDHIRLALVQALKFLPGVSQVAARRILNKCIESGEGVQWNYDLWRVGSI